MLKQPLWYHKDVAIFNKEIQSFCERIENLEFDLILFENIPDNEVKDFYPETVRAYLHNNYKKVDQFLAPRTPEESFIEVFIRP